MERDTDLDWNTIAAANPFFGVLANERFLGKTLSPQVLSEFYGSGRADIGMTLREAATHFRIKRRFRRALDFGCGVGRLSKAMAEHAHEVIGVDISENMLRTAREVASAKNITYLASIPEGTFDWINSVIVFQHIPPTRGVALLREILAKAEPDAFVAIQLPFYRDSRFFSATLSQVGAVSFDGESMHIVSRGEHGVGAMLMFDYPWAAVFAAFVETGFQDFHLVHTDHGGVHGAWIFSSKRS